MDMQFWRLATSIQALSSLLIAVFFVALARTSKSRALRLWSGAWLADFLALAIVSAYWGQLVPLLTAIGSAGYVFFKSTFIVLLVLGAVALVRDRRSPLLTPLLGVAAVLAAAAGVLSLRTFYYSSFIESGVIAAGLLAGAAYLVRHRLPRGSWLAACMAIRALLALVSIFGNLTLWRHWPITGALDVPTVMSISSSLDAITEWAVGLASLLVFYAIIQRDLARSNAELRAAQRSMQELVNHDQLTGLLNRRALPEVLEQARAGGASVVFFDIDHFKRINDTRGHEMGDTCLKRFAAVLRESFRADDRIVRYAGDEFIVVAPALHADGLRERIESVRVRLEAHALGTPAIQFSHGVVAIPPGGNAEAALREADREMYAAKARHARAGGADNVTPLRPAG